ncbi:hypothetical protein EKD04_020890 [Chloroflexales bacterium ZM16-3]|nr:hypothetical protein [Chloroflexales bacterium ZM16-3]
MPQPFERSLRNNYQIFQRHAFRKHTDPNASRNVINIALFDIYSVLMTRYSEEFVTEHADEFHQRFYDLLAMPGFQAAITKTLRYPPRCGILTPACLSSGRLRHGLGRSSQGADSRLSHCHAPTCW